MSEVKQEDRVLNGLTVTTRMLPPMRAYKLLARLGKLARPISRALSDESLAKIKAGDYSAAVPVALAVFTDLTDAEAESLALALLAGTAVDVGDAVQPKILQLTDSARIDAAFAGNLKAMLSAMMFALEVNYKDFFSASGRPANTTPTP